MAAKRKAPLVAERTELDLLRADLKRLAAERDDARHRLIERTAERDEALEQQTATAEVLGVINSSPGDLAPVFDVVLERATALCDAPWGNLYLVEEGVFIPAAARAETPELVTLFLGTSLRPGPLTNLGRVAKTKAPVHMADVADDDAYRRRDPFRVRMVEILGVRAVAIVPLLKSEELVGALAIYRRVPEPFTDKQIALLQNFAAQAVIAMENARLITETRQRTAELQASLEFQTATSDVLQIISRSTFDLQPVLDTLVATAKRLCNADMAIIYRRVGDTYRLAANLGFPPEYEAFARTLSLAPSRASVTQRAALERRISHVADIAADPEYELPEASELGNARTALGVPLLREGEPVGVFTLARQRVEPFSQKEIALVSTFADQAVIAMENARLMTETRQRTEELQEALAYQTATGEVLRIVASSPDRLAPVLDAILERATELCGVKAGNLYLHEDGAFKLVAAHHPDAKMAAEMLGNSTRPGSATATYRAFATKMPVHIIDIADDDAYRAGDPFRVGMVNRGVRALLVVPLVRGDESIGTVAIYRPVPEPFTEAQIELVRTFADQAVVAIENARLFGELRAARDAAEAAYKDLQTAQSSLVQAQKMAALGQLTAGIAHEIKNPLNFVNNFASLSAELLDELKDEVAPAMRAFVPEKRDAIDETIEMLTSNLEKIVEHGQRADNIVKSMLEHSRGVSGERREVDLNGVIEEALNLAYHGARAHDQSFNISLERDYAAGLKPIELAPQEITRVFLNLFGNGFYAASRRALDNGDGSFRPVLTVRTREADDAIEVRVRDNGTGIPPDIRDKLFQPFFTTKPTGEGTGLGLSISYDIVTQQHGGTITVESEPGSYTEFTVRLPRH